MSDISGWFLTNKDVISGIASMTAVIGLFATALALFKNARQSRAQAIYEIQRDARKESATLFESEEVAKALLGQRVEPINATVGSALNFYASVYQMRRLGVLDDRLFGPFRAELRVLVRNDRAWECFERVRSGLDRGFVDLAEELRNQN